MSNQQPSSTGCSDGEDAALPIDLTFEVCEIIQRPRRGQFSADTAGLERAAALLRVPAVLQLSGDYAMSGEGRQKVRAVGQIIVRLVQTCVVTGETVEQTLELDFDARFWPLEQAEQWWSTAGSGQILEDFDLEAHQDGRIDLGRYIYELVAVSLDPYPRKHGASLPTDGGGDGGLEEGPFAVLKDLKI